VDLALLVEDAHWFTLRDRPRMRVVGMDLDARDSGPELAQRR
jgi:hypothetical protein